MALSCRSSNSVVSSVLQVLQNEPRPLRQLDEAIPRDLETICLKAMAKPTHHRYQSAKGFGDDLRRFLTGDAIQARPIGSLEPDAAGGTEAHLRLSQLPKLNQDSPETEDEDDPPDAERQLFLRAIEFIRDDFGEQTWKAFWRTTVDGCSAQEVGDELGMRPGTVRVAKSRVLQRLRDRLGDEF